MWPLDVASVATAIATAAVPARRGQSVELDAVVARRVIRRAIGWSGTPLARDDVFFPVDVALDAQIPEALAVGAICVVAAAWPGLEALDDDALSRCFVATSPLEAYRCLAAFLRERFTFPVIAVGGSNGKTTTKDMITTLLRAGGRRVTSTPGTNNGWVGTPITLCHPAHTTPAPDALVIEIGIDAPGAMRQHVTLAAPDIGVLTALGPEHLAGLGTHDDAIREELELFAGSKRRVWLEEEPALASRLSDAREGDLIVRNEDRVERVDLPPGVDVVSYAWRRSSPFTGSLKITWRGETQLAVVPVPGAHNGRNAALAVATALLAGRSLGDAARALADFRGPAQRCAIRTLASGCVLIDDSYNASPSSFDAALDVLAAFDPALTRVVILGDMLDLGDETADRHAALVPRLATLAGAHLRLYGPSAGALAAALADDTSRLASIGRAAPPDDPGALIDLASLDRSVVLVKGSRGMSLERAVARVEAMDASAIADDAIHVAIAGEGASAVAIAIRANTPPEAGRRHVVVRVLDHADLAGGAAQRRSSDIAILTHLAFATEDVEQELAALAQLVIHVRPSGIVFLPPPSADPVGTSDEAISLLADVIPPHARSRFAPVDELLSSVISEIHELSAQAGPK